MLLTLVVHVNPVGQAAHTVRTWPSVPTANAVGVLAAVPVIRLPLPVMQVHGIPVVGAVPQVSPVVQAAQAIRIWPSVPTGSAVGVFAAVPEISAPLPVMQAQGMAGEEVVVQVKPVVQAAQAVRTWPSVPEERAVGVLAALAARI